MKTINYTKSLLSLTFFSLFSLALSGQCETWIGHELKEQAESAHVVYRQALENEEYDLAFENWQKAYEIAPAADGNRGAHYTDGVTLYGKKIETDPDNKAEYLEKIDMLFNQAVDCYEAGKIKVYGCQGDDCGTVHAGQLLGLYGYNMVYQYQSPLSKAQAVFEKAVEKAGLKSEYTILNPYAHVAVNQYKREKIDADKAREIHQQLMDIADHNIENNEEYGPYYQQAKESMLALWKPIESEIFDCEYFKNKYEPIYKENPEDLENLKVVYAVLKKQGCEDTDPLVAEVKEKYEKLAAEKNAEIQAEFEKNNPGVYANRLYKEGKYEEAIMKYEEALKETDDAEKKASYHFSIASIKGRKLNQYSAARKSAREALKYRPNWGKPEMLIGDLYARSSNSCGKDAYSRGLVILAAIDKWTAAKAKDPEVAQDAMNNINKYSAYIPPKEDVFMRGEKEGNRVSTGCWVSEKVRLRYK